MGQKLLTERLAFVAGKIGGTAEAPVIENVLACGATSENKRRYLVNAFAGDRIKRYVGVPVFANHGRTQETRGYHEQIGVVAAARHRDDGMPLIDIAVNPQKELGRAFLWDAEHQSKACGMSHVAQCQTTRAADGWDDVTELVRVESVDVISAGNAATTKGLYENRGTAVDKISLKTFVERFGAKWGAKKWGAATKLCEDMGDMADAPVIDPPADDAPDGDLKTALMAALEPMLEDAFDSGNSDKVVAALKDFIKLHAKHTGKAPDDAPADDAAIEGKKRTSGAILEAVDVCESVGLTPSKFNLNYLAAQPTADREAAARQLKRTTEAATPTSAGRGSLAATLPDATKKTTEGKDGKAAPARVTWD